MEWLLIVACVIGVWTVLNIVGSERQHRIEAMRLAATQRAAKRATRLSAAEEVITVS